MYWYLVSHILDNKCKILKGYNYLTTTPGKQRNYLTKVCDLKKIEGVRFKKKIEGVRFKKNFEGERFKKSFEDEPFKKKIL